MARSSSFMKILPAIGSLVWLPQPALAQALVSETVNGIHRVCLYSSGPLSARLQDYRVGLGQNCPAQYPVGGRVTTPPPTARLERQSVDQGSRACTYLQDGARWLVSLPLDRECPLSAGMILQPNTAE